MENYKKKTLKEEAGIACKDPIHIRSWNVHQHWILILEQKPADSVSPGIVWLIEIMEEEEDDDDDDENVSGGGRGLERARKEGVRQL